MNQQITAVAEQEYVFKLTGRDLVAILQGLDEIQHKVAKSVELKLMAQLEEQVKKDG